MPQAETLYREVLRHDPRHAESLHLLGVLAGQCGHNEQAVELITQAIQLRPNFAVAMGNLGNALRAKGNVNEAIGWYRKAIALMPNYPEAYNNLGSVLRSQGNLAAAIGCFRQAIALMPGLAEAHRNLGAALRQQGDIDGAIACQRQAIALEPNDAQAHRYLANALHDKMQLEEAIVSYRRAIALQPDFAEAYANVGSALRSLGDLEEAIACCRKAIALNPRFTPAYSTLGNTLKESCRLDEAIAAFRQSIALDPADPDDASNLIFALHYHPAATAPSIREECVRWAARHAKPLKPLIQPHTNDRNPHRRLRVGYVSPDLKQHAVAIFLLPLLARHDHATFEIFCYAEVPVPDGMTAHLRGYADHWRSTVGLTDQQTADLIRRDQIDILVDLALHTAHHRLLVFARKPAPVQVTYLAYCSTSGLDTIDYRLTDPYLDPPGSLDLCYTEQSLHLPETYWCYQPCIAAPDPGLLPALAAGQITFGCMNNFCKISPVVLRTWCAVLRAVPNSRLVLHAKQGDHRQRVHEILAKENIAADRLRFVGQVSLADYFAAYCGIDIGLDPFPYTGGTTTCDALWMGVPVVSLAGQTAVARGGLSILSNVGLPQLVARTPEQYVQIAVELAGDFPCLAKWRASMRQRMAASPLMDALRFTHNIEAIYRTIWQKWCGAAGSP